MKATGSNGTSAGSRGGSKRIYFYWLLGLAVVSITAGILLEHREFIYWQYEQDGVVRFPEFTQTLAGAGITTGIIYLVITGAVPILFMWRRPEPHILRRSMIAWSALLGSLFLFLFAGTTVPGSAFEAGEDSLRVQAQRLLVPRPGTEEARQASLQTRRLYDVSHGLGLIVPPGWEDVETGDGIIWHVMNSEGEAECFLKVRKDESIAIVGISGLLESQDRQSYEDLLSVELDSVYVSVWDIHELSGYRARRVIATGVAGDQRFTRLTLQTARDNELFTFVCISMSESFPANYIHFNSMAESFEFTR